MKKKVIVAIFFLFFINFSTALLFINEGLFHFDAVVLAQAVENTYKLHKIQPAVSGRYGSVIINSILYFPFYIFGKNADFSVRFTSILFGSLSTVALFLFVLQFTENFFVAFWSALFFAFCPIYFSPNTYGKEHGIANFFLFFSWFLLLRHLKKNNPFFLILSGLLFVFSISVRESILITIPLFFLLYFSPKIFLKPFRIEAERSSLNIKNLSLFFITVFSGILLLFFLYLKHIIYKELFVRDVTAVKFLGLYSPVLKTAFNDLFRAVPVLVFAFSLIGFFKLCRRKNIFLAVFLFFWCCLIFYFGNLAHYVPRHLDLVVVPFYILAAFSLWKFFKQDRIISIVIATYFVIDMFIFMYPMLKFRHHYNGIKQFALYVKEKTPPNALIITMDDAVFIQYYANRKTLTHPINDYKNTHTFLRTVASYLVNGVDVYLTGSGLSYDSSGIFRSILQTNFDIEIVGTKLTEDYHRPELDFTKYEQPLYKLDFKFKTGKYN